MASNVWDEVPDWGGVGALRLDRADGGLGAAVWELGPGSSQFVYHFHHASEELLVVLDGEMTMKTEEGERLVRRGEAVIFPVGPTGGHGFRVEGDGRCRYLMASSAQFPEVAEYPDLGQITAQGPSRSQTGEQLWFIHDVGDDADG
jgi:uncharacterized cupin superfamily protein